ncbi:MAG: DUF6527 family protein [Actinomycetes bacterium]
MKLRPLLAALVARARRALGRRLLRRQAVVSSVFDVPDRTPPLRAYVVASSDRPPQWVAFDCPCRRGHRILLNLSKSRSPRWELQWGRGDLLTIRPSVDATSEFGRCHFWCLNGRIRWV